MNNKNWIVGICQDGESKYEINGVRYVVASRFRPFGDTDSLQDRMRHIIKSKIIDLTAIRKPTTIDSEYVCSAAGKED